MVRSVSGRQVPFVSVEDLIVLEMLWHRAKDVPDVQALVAAGGSGLDAEYVRETLSSLLPHPRHGELARFLADFGGVSPG